MQTERGNINQEIIKHNMMLEQARAMLELAKQEVQSIQYAKIKNAAVSVNNEVMEMIAKARERKGRLDLPIVSGKHLRKISARAVLQSVDNAEKFIITRKIDSFESLAKYPEMRERLQNLLEQGEKITPKQWKAEIQSLQSESDSISRSCGCSGHYVDNSQPMKRGVLLWGRRTYHHRFQKGSGLQSSDFYQIRELYGAD